MVFEEIIRHSPRRRALPWIAEGFSPTASAPLGYQLSAIAYRLFIQPDGQRSSRLSAISYRLSAIHSARRHAAHTGLDSQSPSARRPALRSAISYQLSPIGYSFSPTARGAYRIIAILRYIDPCPGLPCRARRPLPATGAVQSNRPCERCDPHLRAFASPREPVRCTQRRGVTVLLVKGRSYAQPDPRAFADAILRRE